MHLLDESRKVLSDYLKVPLNTCVLVPNASTAFDTIVRNLVWEPGDVLLCFDIVYDSFEYTLQYLSEMTPLEYVKIDCDITISDDHVCNALETEIEKLREEGKSPRMAVFDTISSLPAIRLPFERLTQLCRRHNILSSIDGAHGIGQLDVDLLELDADFFMSNLHKWLYVPRPCALMYVPQRNQNLLRSTLPTGFGWLPRSSTTPMEGEAFAANFQSVGTLDDMPYLCIKAALDWRKRITWNKKQGEEALKGYLHHLAAKGGKVTAEILGTEVLDNEQGSLSDCALVNVRLPLPADFQVRSSTSASVGALIMRRMMEGHYTAVVVAFYRRYWWVRLSAQVYLTLDDFEKAALKLRDICQEILQQEGEGI